MHCRSQSLLSLLGRIICSVIFFGLCWRLYFLCWNTASDFEVYWLAAQAWLQGQSPYAQYSTAYPGLVFKYPPWILALFIPFAWIPLNLAKIVWLNLQLLSFFLVFTWTKKQGVPLWLISSVSLCFWWIWLAHAYYGQVMVFLLAFALLNFPFKKPLSLAALVFFFSSKIFSSVSLIGVFRSCLRTKVILWGIGLFLISHILLLFSWDHFLFFKMNPVSIQSVFKQFYSHLYLDWGPSALSGHDRLLFQSQSNHGLTALIVRLLGTHPVTQTGLFASGVSIGLTVILSGIWIRSSKYLNEIEQWSGWLALGVIIHPLAWDHSFVITFPLCTLAAHQAHQSRNHQLIALAWTGIVCISLLIPQVIGPQVIGIDALYWVDWCGTKAWGAILCAIALVLASKANRNYDPATYGTTK